MREISSGLSAHGILGQAISWLLKSKNIKFSPETFAQDHEIDFLIERNHECILLECKMHKIKGDPDSVENNLAKDLKQMQKTLEALPEGARSSKAILITNYDLNAIEPELQNIRTKLSRMLTKHKITIMDPPMLRQWLDKSV